MRPTRHQRRLLAPEVVQTSSMDCGPAALKCLLEGHGVPVSYGRLREACQTDVDGTSIDTLEVVAQQLGLQADQVLVPVDHVLRGAQPLPAIAVVRHADTAAHFVVVWRRVGPWLQLMDPAMGRRWVRASRFLGELYPHTMAVDAGPWRDWAGSDDFLQPLRARMQGLGMRPAEAQALTTQALADPRWFSIGALDASVRLVQSMATAGGVRAGSEATALVRALYQRTTGSGDDIYGLLPPPWWSVAPDASNTDASRERLLINGAVLLRIGGLRAERTPDQSLAEDLPPLSLELQAALTEKPERPLATLWQLLRQDGLGAPLALAGASIVAAGAVTLEALLMRGLFDIGSLLAQPSQRLLAALALLLFVALLLGLQLPIVGETLRQGRHLETRLRIALLRKLPRLNDRYFQSRPVSDMADRSHAIQGTRGVPSLGLQGVTTLVELLLTLAGIAWVAPASAGQALLLAAVAIALPLLAQPLLNERDLRVRNQAGALNGFYLDALLGLMPVRAHSAQRNVRRQHEGLLVEWAGSLRGWIRLSLAAEGLQALLCTSLAGWLLVSHFQRAGGVGGADLLLVFWALKLPATGAHLAGLAQAYPSQRNALLRLLEPLAAPEAVAAAVVDITDGGASDSAALAAAAGRAPPAAARNAAAAPQRQPSQTSPQRTQSIQPALPTPLPRVAHGVAITIAQGSVLAAGHTILADIDLHIAAGEQVAIVGPSGAGKSSLLGLLLGWHRLAEGRLLLDGAESSAAGIEALRPATAWVDPAVQIWNHSFLDNLAYASDDSALGRVGAVMQASQLRPVLEKLPQGLQTLLGEGGALLSGGEGQRVRLGRALLMPGTRLALLDEPFRGLDRPQRQALLAEARRWWQGVTLLCVTHDVGETLGFDRVLVVADGRIVQDGPPQHLAAQAGVYQDLLQAEAQLRESLWQGPHWRRIGVQQGRIVTHEAAP